MIWYVWASDCNNAVEEMWHCNEYLTVAQALSRKRYENLKLYKIEVLEEILPV